MLLLRQLFDVAGGGPETDAFKHLAAAFTVLRSLGSAKTASNCESSRIVRKHNIVRIYLVLNVDINFVRYKRIFWYCLIKPLNILYSSDVSCSYFSNAIVIVLLILNYEINFVFRVIILRCR